MNRSQMLRKMVKELENCGVEAAAYEARTLLEWILHIDRSEFYMNPQAEISPKEQSILENMLQRRKMREPLQYIMNSADFMGFSFYVNENVLIPRFDTENLVEFAISEIKELQADNSKHPLRVLDLCCGSGCIGISIKKLCDNTEVFLSDISEQALSVARENAGRLGADVTILHSDLFSEMDDFTENKKLDYIISNPPYIPSKVIGELMPEVKDHEPLIALDGTEDGLFFYKKIISQALDFLNEGGHLAFEIGFDQGKDVSILMKKAGFGKISLKKDLAGLDRIVSGVKI